MANTHGLAEHHASVTVNAPVHQVYSLFTHFNDFPKFMSFVREVTYYDNQRSHWVAAVAGQHEWDAVNEGWVEDQQIGWRSTSGMENIGRVTFQPAGADQTRLDVLVSYDPPAGVLGDIGESLGVGSRFQSALQQDLDNFARMVEQSPAGALDPTSSNYLFHGDSAAAKGTTTAGQDATMEGVLARSEDGHRAGSGAASVSERPVLDRDIINEPTNIVGTGSKQTLPGGAERGGASTGGQDAGDALLPPDTPADR
jgi:uncharacterized membrane protein